MFIQTYYYNKPFFEFFYNVCPYLTEKEMVKCLRVNKHWKGNIDKLLSELFKSGIFQWVQCKGLQLKKVHHLKNMKTLGPIYSIKYLGNRTLLLEDQPGCITIQKFDSKQTKFTKKLHDKKITVMKILQNEWLYTHSFEGLFDGKIKLSHIEKTEKDNLVIKTISEIKECSAFLLSNFEPLRKDRILCTSQNLMTLLDINQNFGICNITMNYDIKHLKRHTDASYFYSGEDKSKIHLKDIYVNERLLTIRTLNEVDLFEKSSFNSNLIFTSVKNVVSIWDIRNPSNSVRDIALKPNTLTFKSIFYNKISKLIPISEKEVGVAFFDLGIIKLVNYELPFVAEINLNVNQIQDIDISHDRIHYTIPNSNKVFIQSLKSSDPTL